MSQVDDAYVFEAIRYQEAYRAEGRRKHHQSVPGPLVAELLRYIENSIEGATQEILENELLVGGVFGGGHRGAKWRAYVTRRDRDDDEKQAWRKWHDSKREKNRGVDDDPFVVQPLLPPQGDCIYLSYAADKSRSPSSVYDDIL